VKPNDSEPVVVDGIQLGTVVYAPGKHKEGYTYFAEPMKGTRRIWCTSREDARQTLIDIAKGNF